MRLGVLAAWVEGLERSSLKSVPRRFSGDVAGSVQKLRRPREVLSLSLSIALSISRYLSLSLGTSPTFFFVISLKPGCETYMMRILALRGRWIYPWAVEPSAQKTMRNIIARIPGQGRGIFVF